MRKVLLSLIILYIVIGGLLGVFFNSLNIDADSPPKELTAMERVGFFLGWVVLWPREIYMLSQFNW